MSDVFVHSAERLAPRDVPAALGFVADLAEQRRRLVEAGMGRGLAEFNATQQQAAGVIHYLCDKLVGMGLDRAEVSQAYGFGRIVADGEEQA